MIRNLKCIFNEKASFFVLQQKLSCSLFIRKSVLNEQNFSTSTAHNSPDPVPLSHSVFQPEQPLTSNVPVIILHGLLGSKQNWRGLGKAIAFRCRRKVYALDARNHGDSPHSVEMDYRIMAEDVKCFMNSSSIPEAVVIGHSMGGRTAMHLALTNESLVNKLIVVDVSPRNMPSQSEVILGYMVSMVECLPSLPNLGIVQARKTVDEILRKTIPKEGIRQFLLTNLTEVNKTLSWKANLDVLRQKFSSHLMSFPHVSSHFLKETLFVCGGNSSYVPIEDHPYIKSIFPKTEIVIIPEAGHWVHSEKPSEFLEAVCSFL